MSVSASVAPLVLVVCVVGLCEESHACIATHKHESLANRPIIANLRDR